MSKGRPEPFERGRTAGDPGPDVDRTEALRERLFGNAVGALELYTIYLGERLGLYRHDPEPFTPSVVRQLRSRYLQLHQWTRRRGTRR